MRRPSHNLRDLFWLVAVVAILIAWGADHRRLSRQIELLVKHQITAAE